METRVIHLRFGIEVSHLYLEKKFSMFRQTYKLAVVRPARRTPIQKNDRTDKRKNNFKHLSTLHRSD